MLIKVGFLIIILCLLTGCDCRQNTFVKKRSGVDKLKEEIQIQNQSQYSITRTVNGTYIYTDKPATTDMRTIFINQNDDIITD